MTEPTVPQEPAQPTIEKTGDPAKLTYQEGDVFDLTGFSAKVVATDGSETPVPADKISADKTGALTTSDTTVTLTVAPDGLTPATYNYAITVNAATPSTPGGLAALGAPAMLGETSPEIQKTGDPAKLTYLAGDVFDLTGFSAEVVATDGSTTLVSADKISVDKTGPLATSDTEVTITVAPDGMTPVTYPYTITVNAAPAQWTIVKTGDPAKLTYQAGDVFNLTGFSAKVVAADGSETLVAADKITVDKTGALATTDTQVTITVAPDGLTPVAYPYNITVNAAPKTNPTFSFSSASVSQGGTAVVKMYLANNPTFRRCYFSLTYDDTNLVLQDIQPGSILSGISTKANNGVMTGGNRVKVQADDHTTMITGNGEFLILTFLVNPSAASGNYDIGITMYSENITDYFQDSSAKFMGITPDVNPGTISVNAADGNIHQATVDSGITGGTLSLDSAAKINDSDHVSTSGTVYVKTPADVTVTVTPDAGKQFVDGSLTYTTGGGRTYPIAQTGGIYSFPMTDGDVTVTAKFRSQPTIVKTGDPTRLSYCSGEPFDKTGFSAVVDNGDGTQTAVSAGQVKMDKTGALAAGDTQITLTVAPPGMTPVAYTYDITVTAGTTADFQATSGLSKTTFLSGDTFNLIDSGFSAKYGGTAIVQKGSPVNSLPTTVSISTDPSGQYKFTDADIATGKDIKIIVTYNGLTQTFTYHINVLTRPQLTISAPADPIKVGDSDNPSTADVTVTINGNGHNIYGFKLGMGLADGITLKSYKVGDASDSITPAVANTIEITGNGTDPVVAADGSLVLHLTYAVAASTAAGDQSIFVYAQTLLDNSLNLDTLLNSPDDYAAAVNAIKICSINTSANITTTIDGVAHPLVSWNNAEYYQLSTPGDIVWFANKVNSGANSINALVMNDIDMTGMNFTGIGTEAYPYTGTFMGNNQKPYTITLNMTGGSNVGLFNFLGDGGSAVGFVAAINVAGTINATGDNVGGIAGKVNNATISTCNTSVAITTSGSYAGGIAGNANQANMGYCKSSATVTASGSYVGSIAGSITFSSDISFSVNANTGAAVSGNNYVGGLAGYIGSDSTAICGFGNNSNSAAVTGSGDYVGGLIGFAKNLTGFSTNVNSGAVSGKNYVGGLVGYGSNLSNQQTTYSNFGPNSGAVSGQNNVGGFAGYIENSTLYSNQTGSPVNAGAVTVTPGASGTVAAGGVAGTAKNTTLVNVSNKGLVSGPVNLLGGIAGYVTGDSGSITNSWNTGDLTTTASTGAAGGIIGKNDAAALILTDNVSLGDITAPEGVVRGGVIADKGSVDSSGFTNNVYATEIGAPDAGGATAPASRADFVYTNTTNNYVVTSLKFTGQGDGTIANPFQLSTPNDLIWFCTRVNQNGGGNNWNTWCAVLTQDIDMSGVSLTDFPGIGVYNSSASDPTLTEYGGTFDGAGHTVTLNMSGSNVFGCGFFNYCRGATIKNLTIAGSITNPTGSCGGIAGTIVHSTIKNCKNTATITGLRGAGGIACGMNMSQIIGCTNSGNIVAGDGSNGAGAGGIVCGAGEVELIQDCTNSGRVSGGGDIGGIVGGAGSLNLPESGMPSSVTIKNCTNTGDVISTGVTLDVAGLGSCAGGILGAALDGPVSIDNCKNSGNVRGTANNLGGVLGYGGSSLGAQGPCDLTLTNSTNSGSVTSTYAVDDSQYTGSISVAGIVGNSEAAKNTITDNENTGPINGGLAKNVSAIVGSGGNSEGINRNYTNKDYGNDAKNQGIILGNKPPDTPVTPVTHSGGGSAPSVTIPTVDIPTVTMPQVETPGDSTPGGEVPMVEVPAASGLGNTDFVLGPAPIDTTGAAAQSAESPLLAQNDSKNPETTSAQPDQATASGVKQATIYQVVQDAIQNNPSVVRGLLLFVILLAGLGGFRRYRKNRGV